jgi:hypothetical protein
MVELKLESSGGKKRNKEEQSVSCEGEGSDSGDDIIAADSGCFLELFFDKFTIRDFRNAKNQWHPCFEKVLMTTHRGFFQTFFFLVVSRFVSFWFFHLAESFDSVFFF